MVRVARSLRPRVAILLYHRVADLPTDPQLLAVSLKNFEAQLEMINQAGMPVPLSHLDEALERRPSSKPAIVVTFDDGYADNLHCAKPLLSRYGVPATVFVSSGFVRSQKEFLHDELEKIFLRPGRLPESLELAIGERVHRWELGPGCWYTASDYSDYRGWNVLSPQLPTERHRVYRGVFEALFSLDSEQRQQCLAELLRWSGADPAARESHRPMSEAEVVDLHAGGLVEVGGHTVNHPLLSSLPASAQRAEVGECKLALEAMLRSPITTFAYPYGGRMHYNTESVSAVRDAGFKHACSNFGGVVSRTEDKWQLPRFLVRDWSGPAFRERLHSWLWHS